MAALNYAAAATTTTTSLHQLYRLNPRKPILLVCCFSTSFPAKPTRRRNHLRQKFLKTLKEPIIPKLPPANPIIPIDPPILQQIEESEGIEEIQESDKSKNSEAGNGEVQKFEEWREVEVSVPAGVSVDGNVGILAKNPILKYGLWLLGAFVFHTVSAIWVFGSGSFDDKNEILNGSENNSEVGGDGKDKSRVNFFLNGNVNGKMGMDNSAVDSIVYVDEMEMERKIEEIRVMAREAREKERLESKKNGLESEDREETDGGKYFKSGIEEEVDNRLIKLRKKLESVRDKIPVPSRKYDKRKDGVEKGELDNRESNGALLFKKKYKFKGSSSDPVEKPKGFTGSDDNRSKTGNWKEDELLKSGIGDNDAIGSGDGEKQTELSDVHVVAEDNKKGMPEMSESTKKTTKKVAKERRTSKQGKANGVAKPKVIDVEAKKLSKGNGSLKGKGFGAAQSAAKKGSENDFWWLNLPYVLVILMQRGHDGEGREGLYTLKSIPTTEDRTSHIVGFEDRADANNFCYLLQSFFEDLEDFNADVVPLTVKELNETVKSNTMRVIVVKRGQLELYAGQPLADAEMALRAMVKQG